YFHDGTATYRIDAPGAATKILDQPLISLTSDGAFLYGLFARGAGLPPIVVRVKPNGHGQTYLAKGGLVGSFYPPRNLAVDETFVYYFDPTLKRIMRVCKAP